MSEFYKLHHMRIVDLDNQEKLNDIAAQPKWFPAAEPTILQWEKRKRLLEQELTYLNADIICLQEVQQNHYHSFFVPFLETLGYQSSVAFKTREQTPKNQDDASHIDGCATFYKAAKFKLIRKEIVDYTKEAQREPEFQPATRNHLAKPTHNIALLLAFDILHSNHHSYYDNNSHNHHNNNTITRNASTPETRPDSSSSPSPTIVVGNTHLYWNHNAPDIQLWQAACFIHGLRSLLSSVSMTTVDPPSPSVAVFACGDFNSVPQSSVHTFLSRGEVDIVPFESPRCKSPMLHDSAALRYLRRVAALRSLMPFRSAYSEDTVPLSHSSKTDRREELLDYIWYGNISNITTMIDTDNNLNNNNNDNNNNNLNNIVVRRLLLHDTKAYLPSVYHPSDHLPLFAELELN